MFWWGSFTVWSVDPHCATWPWTNQMTAYMCVSVCWILTPLCRGHSEVLRWLVGGPEFGVFPFSWGLIRSVDELSVVCSMRFEVLCRSTKAGPSAPLISPPSSLKSWISRPKRRLDGWSWLGDTKPNVNMNIRRLRRDKNGVDMARWYIYKLNDQPALHGGGGNLTLD